ncbi:MAG TPA: ATP-grasp domain-containing protein [Gemmatimonadaceae bacterium]|nr:ATP-grasp domain-containing protein [Gemmatimonadaceae bacterium]
MRVTILHTKDAVDPPPADPVLEQVTNALRQNGHESVLLAVDADVTPLVEALRRDAPGLVFNFAESFAGKSALESNVAALLNLLGLRYTGSSPAGLLLAGDKSLTKKVLSFHKILTPQFATFYRGALDSAGDLTFPVIVKPPQEDASLGITAKSVVHDLKELFEAIDRLQEEYQSPVLVEQFIEGREFYVGVLGNVNLRPLPIIELDFSKFPPGKPRIASWEAKWGDQGTGTGAEFAGTESVFPSDLAPAMVERMHRTAIDAFQALRLRDYARIDLRVNAAGDVYVLEVNPNCYLERQGEFARAAEKDGLAYEKLIAAITELALGRYSR